MGKKGRWMCVAGAPSHEARERLFQSVAAFGAVGRQILRRVPARAVQAGIIARAQKERRRTPTRVKHIERKRQANATTAGSLLAVGRREDLEQHTLADRRVLVVERSSEQKREPLEGERGLERRAARRCVVANHQAQRQLRERWQHLFGQVDDALLLQDGKRGAEGAPMLHMLERLVMSGDLVICDDESAQRRVVRRRALRGLRAVDDTLQAVERALAGERVVARAEPLIDEPPQGRDPSRESIAAVLPVASGRGRQRPERHA